MLADVQINEDDFELASEHITLRRVPRCGSSQYNEALRLTYIW